MPTPLGEKLRKLRKAKGFTLESLADATESSKSYIWELENSDVARPSAEKLTRIASVLDTIPEFFIDDDRTEATASDRDQKFFRNYVTLDEKKKNKLHQFLKMLDDDD